MHREAFRIQNESDAVRDRYGRGSTEPAGYGDAGWMRNEDFLVARRLVERGVRFVQLFHRGWDQHSALSKQLPHQCLDTDQPSAALIHDLEQRGLLDETLVIWGGEFGRTVYSQGTIGSSSAGRDHHGRAFSLWMAGGGIKPGVYGSTDDYCWSVEKPGETVEIRWLPGGTIEVYEKDKRIGAIEKNVEFAAAVWKMWFGEKLADGHLETLKKELLGNISAVWAAPR